MPGTCGSVISAVITYGGSRRDHPDASRAETSDACHVGLAYLSSSDSAWLTKARHTVTSHRRIPWIAIVDPGLIERDPIREFIAIHCIDYQTHPLDRQRLLAILGHAVGMARLVRPDSTSCNGTGCELMLIGHSPAMNALRRDLAKIASVDACALITGETGTGKELAARAIHQLSSRRDRPFVAIRGQETFANC